VFIFFGVFVPAIGQGVIRRARNPLGPIDNEMMPEELRSELERVLGSDAGTSDRKALKVGTTRLPTLSAIRRAMGDRTVCIVRLALRSSVQSRALRSGFCALP
jgi:hypothetical protein